MFNTFRRGHRTGRVKWVVLIGWKVQRMESCDAEERSVMPTVMTRRFSTISLCARGAIFVTAAPRSRASPSGRWCGTTIITRRLARSLARCRASRKTAANGSNEWRVTVEVTSHQIDNSQSQSDVKDGKGLCLCGRASLCTYISPPVPFCEILQQPRQHNT